jgi:hypothetical protein
MICAGGNETSNINRRKYCMGGIDYFENLVVVEGDVKGFKSRIW